MWQIRRFKSSIFSKLKAKFNMHFKLQKIRAFLCNGQKLEWVLAWTSFETSISRSWDLNQSIHIQIQYIEWKLFTTETWFIRLGLRPGEKWPTSQQPKYVPRNLDTFQIPQMFCPDTSFEAFSKLQLHEWFISLSLI